MKEAEISRRDFLKNFPQHVIKGAQSDSPRVAVLNVDRCLAWGGADCQWCYLVCPLRDKALFIQDLKPVIYPAFCNGCGRCMDACKTVNDLPAITYLS